MKSLTAYRYRLITLLIAYLLVALSAPSYAEDGGSGQWRRTTLPNQSLLPVANVHRVMQDSRGYIWYATFGGGLCRDNGYQIERFFEDGGTELAGCSVYDVVENTDGRIWAATNVGLCWLSLTDGNFLHRVKDAPFSMDYVSSLTSAHDGSVWAACGNCIGRFDGKGNLVKTYMIDTPGDGVKCVNDIFEDDSHTLWLLECRGGLRRYDSKKDDFVSENWQFAEPVEMVDDELHKCYWIATWGGGIVCRTYTGEAWTASPSALYNIGISLTVDKRQLLMSDMEQLHLFDIEKNGTLRESDALQQFMPKGKNILDKITLDKEGNLWVASFSPHTFILSKNESAHIPYNKAFIHIADEILALTNSRILPCNIAVEGNGLWMWQGRVGVMYYSERLGTVICPGTFAPGGDSNMKRCVGKAGVWTLCANELLHTWMDGETPRTEVFLSLQDGEHLVDVCDLGNEMWLATLNSIYHWDGKRIVKHSDVNGNIVAISMDSKGKPLVVTANTPESFSCAVAGADGSLWLGNSDGVVYRQESGGKQPKKMFEVMPHESVTHIACDGRGHVWAITDHTLCEYSPSTGAKRIVNSSAFVPQIEFFRNLCPAKEGMYVGASGMLMLMPSLSALDNPSHHVAPLVNSVGVDGQHIVLDGCVAEIEAGKRLVEVRLTTLQFASASEIYYAYRIPEISSEWIQLPKGQNELRILLPAAGTFTLEAKATDEYGVWGEPLVMLTLHKLPYWWETWWAYVLYVIVALAIVTACVMVYVRNQRREMEWKRHKEVLQLRISHLLEQVDTTISSTSSGDAEDAESGDATDAETAGDEFIHRVVACIEQHLGENYSVEQLASDMCMERTSLYKRLTSIIDQTPQKLIRSIRIRRACELLASTSLSITDICYKVGFSTPSYMSRCFVEDLGCKPSEWREKEQVST